MTAYGNPTLIRIRLGVTRDGQYAAADTETLAEFIHGNRDQYVIIGTPDKKYTFQASVGPLTAGSTGAIGRFVRSPTGAPAPAAGVSSIHQGVELCSEYGAYSLWSVTFNAGGAAGAFQNLATGKGVFLGTTVGISGVSAFNSFTGNHDAFMDNNDDTEIGDIVIDVEVVAKTNISDTISKVAKSTAAKQKSVFGVLANKYEIGTYKPGSITENKTISTIDESRSNVYISTPVGWDEVNNCPKYESTLDSNVYYTNTVVTSIMEEYVDYYNSHIVVGINSLGEGLINVCGEGGDIEIGDYIVSSSMPGKGMKQDDDLMRNYTVAKARENVTFSSPTEVKQIACTYHCG